MNFWHPASVHDPVADAAFMDEALRLGRENLGLVAPNPSVGAVVVKDGVIVGRGVTAKGGRPHGEPVALEQAGLAAVGATLYVTLEPCAHRSVRGGKPCVEHVILSGVRRVVAALPDPNPHIAGLGHALLRSAGVSVTVGVGAEQAARDHRGHILRVTESRPMVTLKLARTADGFCAPLGGGRMQVSGDEAMREVHLIRTRHEAIMVGVGTVLSDNPQLTVRLPGLEHRSPIRVVLDSRLQTPPGSALVNGVQTVPLWIIAAENAPAEAERALVRRGVEVMRVGRGADGALDLGAALRLLALRGITRVFSEGGPTVAEALVKAGFADEVIVSTADHALGAEGVIAIRPAVAVALADRARYAPLSTRRVGTDTFETYERLS
ncbi:MAG: bifunctional diaminohydroxyphosphoribosylaminopyrimidine deaminase/5-amino-6-(5-phosphoribosylamino)uracil reductase RibD [Beijerinckiaceae bacterium]